MKLFLNCGNLVVVPESISGAFAAKPHCGTSFEIILNVKSPFEERVVESICRHPQWLQEALQNSRFSFLFMPFSVRPPFDRIDFSVFFP